MHNIINKIIWSIVIILILFFIGLGLYNKYKLKEYTSKFFYMDTYIYIKIYSNDSNKANKALKKVEKIYKEYHELSDRYNSYPNIKNIYYIKNNNSKDEYIKLDKKLYDLIKYGLDYKEKTNGYVDIGAGNLIDVWKRYIEKKDGLPDSKELESSKKDYVEIVLKDNMIKNNHPNIDLGCIAKGYTTEIVGDYLKSIGINKFLINSGGNVLVGENVNKKDYTIGIEDPDVKYDIFDIVKGNNIAVVTSGGYERFYEYNNKRYSHIINPYTLYPSNKMKSITVISKSSKEADIMSTYLFMLDVDEALDYVNKNDLEAIIYTNNNEIKYSKGAKKYEYKKIQK